MYTENPNQIKKIELGSVQVFNVLRPFLSKAVPGTKPVLSVQFVTVFWTQELLVMVLMTMSIVQGVTENLLVLKAMDLDKVDLL